MSDKSTPTTDATQEDQEMNQGRGFAHSYLGLILFVILFAFIVNFVMDSNAKSTAATDKAAIYTRINSNANGIDANGTADTTYRKATDALVKKNSEKIRNVDEYAKDNWRRIQQNDKDLYRIKRRAKVLNAGINASAGCLTLSNDVTSRQVRGKKAGEKEISLIYINPENGRVEIYLSDGQAKKAAKKRAKKAAADKVIADKKAAADKAAAATTTP